MTVSPVHLRFEKCCSAVGFDLRRSAHEDRCKRSPGATSQQCVIAYCYAEIHSRLLPPCFPDMRLRGGEAPLRGAERLAQSAAGIVGCRSPQPTIRPVCNLQRIFAELEGFRDVECSKRINQEWSNSCCRFDQLALLPLSQEPSYEFVPLCHASPFLRHVGPSVIAFRADVLQRMVLDSIADLL